MTVDDIFFHALQIKDAIGRAEYLDKTCADNHQLRTRVSEYRGHTLYIAHTKRSSVRAHRKIPTFWGFLAVRTEIISVVGLLLANHFRFENWFLRRKLAWAKSFDIGAYVALKTEVEPTTSWAKFCEHQSQNRRKLRPRRLLQKSE